MQSPMNSAAPESAMMAPGEMETEPDEGYCIKIEVRGDGTFSVGKYPIEQEGANEQPAPMPPGSAGPTDEGQGVQEFTDVAEAFKAAAQIYQKNPVNGSEQDHMRAAYGAQPVRDADMMAGYQK